MKRFLLLYFFMPIFLFAQKPWIGNNQFLLDYLKNYPALDSGKIYFRIPVVFWLYGMPPTSIKEVKRNLENLNYYFTLNNTGIRFYLADVRYVEKKSKNVINFYTEAPVISTTHRVKGVLNIHLVNLLVKNGLRKKKFVTGVHNQGNATIVLSRANSPSSLAHEAGHFLGLEHPHKDWDKGKRKQECVSRTRTFPGKNIRICEVNGDGLSDTPAEPDLYNYTDDSCHYTGHLRDAWGDLYKPNTDNIMSYTKNRRCRNKFTTMQKAVMLYTAEHKKFSQFWAASENNLHYNFDEYEPDNDKRIATTLKINQIQYHTFHKTFLGPKKRQVDNDTDWFKFRIDTSGKYSIVFKNGKYAFPKMKITILQKKDTLVQFQTDSAKATEFNFNQGVYFLKVEKTEPLPNGQLFDYQIVILKNPSDRLQQSDR